MKLNVLQGSNYIRHLCWALLGKVSMRASKKPGASGSANPEPKSLSANRPSGPALTTVEGTTQTSKEGRLGPNLHVKGEISGREDLIIEGTLEGLVRLDEGKLTIGTTAKVSADLVATEVVVSGNVKGNVRAKNGIEIKRDGSVTGDLTTPQILIEDGAFFKGSIEIDRSMEKEPRKSAFSEVASNSTAPKAAA